MSQLSELPVLAPAPFGPVGEALTLHDRYVRLGSALKQKNGGTWAGLEPQAYAFDAAFRRIQRSGPVLAERFVALMEAQLASLLSATEIPALLARGAALGRTLPID